MTKQQQSEREQACSELRETLKPGTTVYTILRHVSRSGMSRDIDVYVIEDGEPRRITWTVAKAADLTYSRKAEAIKIGGCGMDMGFHIVYNLSRSLYDHGHTFTCIGENCPSNDHSNVYYHAKANECIVCRKDIGPEPADLVDRTKEFKRTSGSHVYRVCSKECAVGPWVHSDGGYALKHRWM